jgi:hypothetical protein
VNKPTKNTTKSGFLVFQYLFGLKRGLLPVLGGRNLSDMTPFLPSGLLEILDEFKICYDCLDGFDPSSYQNHIKHLADQINEVAKIARRLKLNLTTNYCKNLNEYLDYFIEPDPKTLPIPLDTWRWMRKDDEPISVELIRKDMDEVMNSIEKELKERKFVYVQHGKEEFLEKENLFGRLVSQQFPAAVEDIKAAGNCLSVDLNTAAVFHLMRTLEFGLRTLAQHLKVASFKKKPAGKSIPIDLGTWEELIVALNDKLVKLRGITRSKARESELDFYNDLLNELRSVKDLMRNKVMHARITYNFTQAKRAFDHVRGFMQRLATRISEAKQK